MISLYKYSYLANIRILVRKMKQRMDLLQKWNQ